jgi:antitoxin HicB
MTTHPYIGSSLDDFLEEDGVLEEVDAIAIERVLACLVQELMPEKGLTTTEMAQEMNTTSSSFSNFAALE